MQITDMLNQYNQNVANGVETPSGTKGIQQIISSLQELAVGNVFEGTIKSMEDGVVTIGLPNGQSVQAKLDAGVAVKVGQSLFFQVKSNNGTSIAIRPVSDGVAGNPTLLNALDSANLQVNAKNLTMVNTMMQESMSIDKQSLQDMVKLLMNHPDVNVRSVVEMSHLMIPITDEMVAQFENYKSDQYAVLDQLEQVMKELPQKLQKGGLTSEGMLELNSQILQIFTGEEELLQEANSPKGILHPEKIMENALRQGENLSEEAVLLPESKETVEAVIQTDKQVIPKELVPDEMLPQKAGENSILQQETVKESTLSALFKGGDFHQLSQQLSQIKELLDNPNLFKENELNPKTEARELLYLVGEALKNPDSVSSAGLKELVSSKQYRTLLLSMMEQQWLVKPEELKSEHKVGELYERLNRQMTQMEQILKAAGGNVSRLSDTAANIRGNVEFMNQINQQYTYVQIPLKMTGQNAHSDLYVYTDKKKSGGEDGELTAFLHLDLEQLGSTDVSIRMKDKNVTTNFYMEDDISYRLILNHMEELEKRLSQKGYRVSIHAENQEEKINFVEDFLKKDQPESTGTVHRYSFDVKA